MSDPTEDAAALALSKLAEGILAFAMLSGSTMGFPKEFVATSMYHALCSFLAINFPPEERDLYARTFGERLSETVSELARKRSETLT